MHNEIFQNANKVFTGQLRKNKKEGLDVSQSRPSIEKEDLEKLYEHYLIPGLSEGNVEILQHKVFFDLLYFNGRQGKEGLRELNKDSFQVKTSSDGKEYLVVTNSETTKKNQGHEMSTSANLLHNDRNIIIAQPGNVRCPLNSFKHYIEMLNPNINAFFQRPNKTKTGFDAMVLGKETLGQMMKTISEAAGLSKVYTNHCIRHTTATVMHKSGRTLKEISTVTKHKNLQSLECYINKLTLQ